MVENGRELNPYYDPNRKAGEEVSSTGEGRHVLILENNLIHAGVGLVQKGQPVAFWDGVGIALKTATSVNEFVPVDTEGIWRVSVTAINNVVVGQSLYIDFNGIVTDDISDPFRVVFGYALQPIVVNGGPEVIAVKVHWMWPFWWYLFNGV